MKNIILMMACLCFTNLSSDAQSLMDRVNQTKKEANKPAPTPKTYQTAPPVTTRPQNSTPSAQSSSNTKFVNIRNRWKGTFINNENGLTAGALGKPDWWSAQWVFQSVPGATNFVRIKNKWKGTYLHIERGTLEASALGAP